MPEAPPPTVLRVLHVPADHDYSRRLLGPGVVPVDPGPGPDPWTSPALDARWVRAHGGGFDVLHVHFGFENRTPAELRELVGAVREVGATLVVTVHDLVLPHLPSDAQQPYRERLAVLLEHADAVLTLTPGAAAELATDFGVAAGVVAHPPVVPDAELDADRPPRGGGLGLHLKSLRANLAPWPLLDAALRAGLDRGVPVEVLVHAEALRPGFVRADPGLAERVAGWRRAGVRVRELDERLDDAGLRNWLRGLDVSLVPSAHGTHSGWLELCADLGTTVLALPYGHLRDQQPFVPLDPADVAGSVALALTRPGHRVDPGRRRRQAAEVARRHGELYRALRAGVGAQAVRS